MTQKDYIVVAAVLRRRYCYLAANLDNSSRTSVTRLSAVNELNGLDVTIMELATAFKRDNDRFDTQHFVEVVTGKRELTSKPSRKVFKI